MRDPKRSPAEKHENTSNPTRRVLNSKLERAQRQYKAQKTISHGAPRLRDRNVRNEDENPLEPIRIHPDYNSSETTMDRCMVTQTEHQHNRFAEVGIHECESENFAEKLARP